MRKLKHKAGTCFAQDSQFMKWIQKEAAWFSRSVPLSMTVYCLS